MGKIITTPTLESGIFPLELFWSRLIVIISSTRAQVSFAAPEFGRFIVTVGCLSELAY